MASKSTNVEIDERVNLVYQLLLDAHSRHQIHQYCADQWSVCTRQADLYIQRARELQRLDAELERPQWLAGAVARLQDYERRCAQKGNFAVAIKALEDQARLLRFDMS